MLSNLFEVTWLKHSTTKVKLTRFLISNSLDFHLYMLPATFLSASGLILYQKDVSLPDWFIFLECTHLFIPGKVKGTHTESGIKCRNTESGHASLRANEVNLCVAEQWFGHSCLIFSYRICMFPAHVLIRSCCWFTGIISKVWKAWTEVIALQIRTLIALAVGWPIYSLQYILCLW